jgi:hypothetical protein
MSGIRAVFGGGAFWTEGDGFAEPSTLKRVLDILVFYRHSLPCVLSC